MTAFLVTQIFIEHINIAEEESAGKVPFKHILLKLRLTYTRLIKIYTLIDIRVRDQLILLFANVGRSDTSGA